MLPHPLKAVQPDVAEVSIPPPRKWKLLGNEAGESSDQTFSLRLVSNHCALDPAGNAELAAGPASQLPSEQTDRQTPGRGASDDRGLGCAHSEQVGNPKWDDRGSLRSYLPSATCLIHLASPPTLTSSPSTSISCSWAKARPACRLLLPDHSRRA